MWIFCWRQKEKKDNFFLNNLFKEKPTFKKNEQKLNRNLKKNDFLYINQHQHRLPVCWYVDYWPPMVFWLFPQHFHYCPWSPVILTCVSAISLFLLVGSNGLQVWRRLQRLLLDMLDGHHPGQEGIAQHGTQSYQRWQELLPPFVGDVVEVSTFRLRGRLLTGALWKAKTTWRSLLMSETICDD